MTTIPRLATVLFSLALLASACGTTTAEQTTAVTSADSPPPDSGEAAESRSTDATTGDTDGTTTNESADGSASETADDSASETADESATAANDVPDLAAVDGATLESSLLARTLSQPPEVSSARFEGRFSFVGAPDSEAPGEFSLTISGAYDQASQASDVTVDFGDLMAAAAGDGADDESAEFGMFADFFAEPIRIISIGDTAWTNWSFITAFLGPQETAGDELWIEGSADENLDPTAEFGFGGAGEPNEFLEMIKGGKASIEELGTEELRGVTTTHYRALVDAESLSESMSAEERAEFESQLGGGATGRLPMEFWLDDDGLVRKFLIDLSDPGLIDDEDLLAAEVVFEIYDIGQPVIIEPPPADKILTEDELGFGFGDS